MRHATVFTFLLAASATAFGQTQPQLTWQGEVSGGATLFIKGNQVDMQGATTGAVDRPTYRFRDPLPNFNQTVTVGVRRGTGRVQVVEQPTAANQYTASVDIRNDGRPQMYRIEFFWDNTQPLRGNRRNDRNDPYANNGRNDPYDDTTRRGAGRGGRGNEMGGPGGLTWSGQVDNEVFLLVRNRRVDNVTVRGQNVMNERADFTGPLNRNTTEVRLSDTRGRGRIELVEQPSSTNNFVAKIRIVDPDNGAGNYAFRLDWNNEGGGAYNNDGGLLSPSGGAAPSYGTDVGTGMMWSGRVDGRIRVSVRGNQAWSQQITGAPVVDERIGVGSALPRSAVRDLDIRRVRGRDDVEIVQRPSANNNYTLIFEINDSSGGADFYEVQVTWR